MDKKTPDLVIPWAFAVKLLRVHITVKMLRQGYGIVQASQLIEDSLTGEPGPELQKIAQEVLDEAGLEYTRHPDQPGVGTPVAVILDLKKP
jgi:hypothetical protein